MLPLNRVHRDAGASFMTLGDWDVPAHYGDVAAECGAVGASAGVIDRSYLGKVRVTGKDRARFLHGMVTHTVTGLSEGGGNHSAVVDVKGYTLLDVWVHHLGDFLWLETEGGLSQKLRETLNRFLIADDVTLKDETQDWAILGVQGPEALSIIQKVLNGVPAILPEHHTVVLSLNGVPIFVTARSYTPFGGYDLRIAASEASMLWDALLNAGGTPVGWQAADILRIEAGVPRYGADIDDSVSPLEAGLAQAVDFNKGCYIGQEVIAKMHFRGKPRRYLVALHLQGDWVPEVGSPLMVEGQTIGQVTSSAWSPRLARPVVLARVRRGFEAVGQGVVLANGSLASVDALPTPALSEG